MDVYEKNYGVNHLLASLAIEELVRCGVTTFCISSGNWNGPLALAAAKHPQVEKLTHFDERGAAFFALGYGKAHGKPAAVICSSGTAVANYYPAVLEASNAEVPLILLTADRPEEFQDTGANQTFEQQHLFRPYVRWEFTFAAPENSVHQTSVLSTIDHAYFRATGNSAGPVHLNFRFRKPFIREALPEPLDAGPRFNAWRKSGTPLTSYSQSMPVPAESEIRSVARRMQQAKRGLICVGMLPIDSDREAIFSLAETLGWPIVADVCSSLRGSSKAVSDSIVLSAHAGCYLRNRTLWENFAPDFILELCSESTKPSNAAMQCFDASGAERVFVMNTQLRKDTNCAFSLHVEAEPAWFCSQLQTHVKQNSSALAQPFLQAERIAHEVLAEVDSKSELSELATTRKIFELSPAEQVVFLAASLSVRLADWFAPAQSKPINVVSNRGLSGIDGTLASSLGFAWASEKSLTLLCGDLAFLHDLNSLQLLKNANRAVTIVLLNNDGGGIFSLLPFVEFGSDYEKFVGTPHGLHFQHAAEQFSIPYHCPNDMAEFSTIYSQAVHSGGPSIIEIRTTREATKNELFRQFDRIAQRVEEEL